MKRQLGLRDPWIFLAASVLIAQVGAGFYDAHNMEVPGPVFAVNYMAILTAVSLWLERDNRQYRVLWVCDIGFFLCLAWMVVIPYYLVKTRGFTRSGLIMFACAAAYVVAYVIGVLVFI